MPVSRTCLTCGQVFSRPPSGAGKYCSPACYHAAKGHTVECTCDVCRTPFTRTASKVKEKNYCSPKCKNLAQRGERIECTCATCGKRFWRVPSRVNGVNFCSVKCKDALAINGKEYICPVCGKSFIRTPAKTSSINYCSSKCVGVAQLQRFQITCETCGQVFTRTPATVGRFCSHECYAESMEQKVQSTCETCGNTFDHWPSHDRQFCSVQCKLKYTGPTRIEQLVRQALDEISIIYIPQHPMGRYHIDFFLCELDTCLEVDGDYWHSLPETKARDKRRDRHLTNRGYRVVRISESDINAAECVTTLVAQRLGID